MQLTLARWANLVAIPFFLNERLLTLTTDNLELVVTVLWLNAFVPPAIRLLDIRGRCVFGRGTHLLPCVCACVFRVIPLLLFCCPSSSNS